MKEKSCGKTEQLKKNETIIKVERRHCLEVEDEIKEKKKEMGEIVKFYHSHLGHN